MRWWCSVQYVSHHMYRLRRDVISTPNARLSAHTAMWQLRRMSTSLSSSSNAEKGVAVSSNHNVAASPSDDPPAVEVSLSPSTMSSSLSNLADSKRKTKRSDSDAATELWDLQWMLFSLKDNRTGIVTCPDAEERVNGMVLLDTWMIEKMFIKSGWLHQLHKNGELAPKYCSVVGEYKVLRYLLHRFLSDESLWRDELQELLQIILEKGIDSQRRALYGEDLTTASSHFCTGNDGIVSVKIPHSLLSGPENMNFYSEGLQRVLWNFLQLQESSLDAPDVAWRAFVATHRNALFLPSPQRPPFDHCEQIPYLSEAEFAPLVREEEPITNEAFGHSESLVRGVTLNWPQEWKLEDETPIGNTHNVVGIAQRRGDDERRHQYRRDAFYMNLVEPNELDFYEGNNVENTSTSTSSFVSLNVHEKQEQHPQEEKEKHVSWSNSSNRTERGLLNPLNGELEDLHLTRLWDVFQGSKTEDIIDLYRGVRGRLETLQEEVILDSLARKGLLLLFFARDEVKALTPPSVTYQRLRYLHNELEILVSWYYPYANSGKLSSPHLFEELRQTPQLSFSCFAHLHAPLQRNLYRLDSEAASPAQLYHHYCTLYSQDGEKGQLYQKQDTSRQMSIVRDDSIAPHNMVTEGGFPIFELLSELQQMAFQYPFDGTLYWRAEGEPVLESTLSLLEEGTPKGAVDEDIAFSGKSKSSVVAKPRGRPKLAVQDSNTREPQEPPAMAKPRGRPKLAVQDSNTHEPQEPPAMVKPRGRPKLAIEDSNTHEPQEPPAMVKPRGRPKLAVEDSNTHEPQEPPAMVKRKGYVKEVTLTI